MKARILVVDDEEKVCQSLEEILRLENYQVAAVTSGADALSVLRVDNFDLVLLDLKMPGVDGIDVLRSIRSNNPETRVILLTGHGSLETAIEALRLGANDYLLKPASSGEILNSVERALSARAEQIRKRQLLEQLGVSLQRLKDIEGLENTSAVNHAVLSLENGVVVDFIRREVYRGSTRVILTPTEGKLFKILAENRGHVMSHRDLVIQVQGYDASDWEAPEVLRPLVSRLRRKLAAFPGGEKWIANVRGTGYVFDPAGATEK
jgi:DNA-binding response OmpR family regulator